VKKHILPILSLFLVTTFVVSFWFNSGDIIGGGEEGLLFLHPERMAVLHSQLWGELQTGQPLAIEQSRLPTYLFLSQLLSFGIPATIAQLFVFWTLLFVSSIAIYFLLSEFGLKKKMYRIIGALFYILNPFMFAAIWNRYLLSMAFFMPLLPLSLLFFLRVFKYKKTIDFALFILISFVFSFSFSAPSNFIVLWVVLGTFFLTLLVIEGRKNVVRLLLIFLLSIIVWTISNGWWLYPVLMRSSGDYLGAFSGDYNLNVLRSLSSQFPTFSNLTLGYKDTFSGVQIGATVLLIIISFFGFLTKTKYKFFFIALFLISLFFVNGSNGLGGKAFEFLFSNISALQLFRNPYEKFGIVLVLIYSIGIGFGMKLIKETYSKAFIVSMSMFVILALQLWTRPVFNPDAYVQVPSDYEEVNAFLNNDQEDFRLLQMPLNPGDGVMYNWENSSYGGVDASRFLFDKSSMANIIRRQDADIFWSKLRASYYTGEIEKYLPYTNVKYIVFHKDVKQNASEENFIHKGIQPGGKNVRVCSDMIELNFDASNNHFVSTCVVTAKITSNISFLRMNINSPIPGVYKIDIQDNQNKHLVFNGQIEKTYNISAEEIGKNQQVLLNGFVPTEKYDGFNQEEIAYVSFYYFPDKNVNVLENTKVVISDVQIDPGKEILLDYATLAKETNYLKVYRVKDKYYRPRMHAEEGEISFEKKNNAEYSLTVPPEVKRIVFLETYDEGWKLMSGEKQMDHYKAYDYANGYTISSEGERVFVLKYVPQDFVNNMRRISFSVLTIIACIVLFNLITYIRSRYIV
jgi:hypothetical protein